jgi:hypothetical protein
MVADDAAMGPITGTGALIGVGTKALGAFDAKSYLTCCTEPMLP